MAIEAYAPVLTNQKNQYCKFARFTNAHCIIYQLLVVIFIVKTVTIAS